MRTATPRTTSSKKWIYILPSNLSQAKYVMPAFNSKWKYEKLVLGCLYHYYCCCCCGRRRRRCHYHQGDSLVLHCASLLRPIFASLARAHERVRVQKVRAKFDSEINAPFLLNEHGDPHVFFHNNSNSIPSFIGNLWRLLLLGESP